MRYQEGTIQDKKRRPKMPVGIDDFEKLRTMGYYYVDKTGMLRELLGQLGEVNLFTRPRRVGKRLTMSVLKCFFEIGSDPSLFDGLDIAYDRDLCERYQGRYPVVSVSLKDVRGMTFEAAREQLWACVSREARRHYRQLDIRELDQMDAENLMKLCRGDGDVGESLSLLSEILCGIYHKKTIILVDEYDVPLQKAKEGGYYRDMSALISSFFSYGMKGNSNMAFAVVTGCLRVAKESVFTGFNNPKMYTMNSGKCGEWFGFTDREVRKMLDDCGLSRYGRITKEWYDGYCIGDVTDIYNPWSVVSWCDQLLNETDDQPRNYWANSSGNDEVRHLIALCRDSVTRDEMGRLLDGECVSRKINQELTYDTMYDTAENLWGVLFSTGYLTVQGRPKGNIYTLKIPNLEVLSIFADLLSGYFQSEAPRNGIAAGTFCDALEAGDAPEVERVLGEYMGRTVTIHDTAIRRVMKENFYHGIVLGILAYREDWIVASNRSSAEGYADITVEIPDKEIGIVIEMEYAEKGTLESTCEAGLEQIREKHYTGPLERSGYRTILLYGIAFFQDQCRVSVEMQTAPW